VSNKLKLDSHTGLRGIAALMVVCDHYVTWCSPYDPVQGPWIIERILGTGGMGMSVFFTLSGFVIAYNYASFDWKSRPIGTVSVFAWLRFSRLYPVLLLFIILIVMQGFARQQLGDWYHRVTGIVLLAGQSLYPIKAAGNMLESSPYNVSWSISTEVGLYAIFAAAITVLRLSQARFGQMATRWAVAVAVTYLVIIAALSFEPAYVAAVIDKLPVVGEPITRADEIHWFFYVSPYCRFYDFLFGWAAALVVIAKSELFDRLAPVFAAGLLLLVFFYLFVLPFSFEVFQCWAAPLLAGVMASGSQTAFVNRLLSARWLVFVGEVSYSLYLFHVFMVRLVILPGNNPFSMREFGVFAFAFSLSLLLAISAAAGLYVVVEMPAQRFLRKLVAR